MKQVFITILLIVSIYSCTRAKEKVDRVVTKAKSEVNVMKKEIKNYVKGQPPRKSFESRTGLLITDSIFEIAENDTYFTHEGEYSLILRTTENQLNDWIKNETPWDKKWKDGPIPHEVLKCTFGLESRNVCYVRFKRNKGHNLLE